jgi:hypothetical protein
MVDELSLLPMSFDNAIKLAELSAIEGGRNAIRLRTQTGSGE